jgi:hypothetical protein
MNRHNCPYCEKEFNCNHSIKDLTDEEIEDLADKYLSVNYKYGEDIYVLGEVEFARAILRKAQEK